MALYVPNINRWINHYTDKSGSNVNLVADAKSISNGDNVGLATESFMTVSKVEPTAPLPPVPSTNSTSALRNFTLAESALQQAVFAAKRSEIEREKTMPNTGGAAHISKAVKVKRKQNSTNGRKVPKIKKKDLFGTPGDIFKTKLDSKGKKTKTGKKK